MKKISFLVVILSFFATGFAQTAAKSQKKQQLPPFSIILSAGANYSIFTNPANSTSTFTQASQVSGINLGIAGNWPLTQDLSLQAGIRITKKGSKVLADTSYFHLTSVCRPTYVQIPLTLEYVHQLGRTFKIIVNGGGYIAKGIGGKTNYYGSSGQLGSDVSVQSDDKISFGDPGSNVVQYGTFSNMNKYDYGIMGGLGVKYWKLRLMVGYELGLANIGYNNITSPSPNSLSKNKSMSLTLGVQF